MDLDRPGLHLRRELLVRGYCDDELGRLRRSGQATTVRRGAYVASTDLRLLGPETRHELAVRAAIAQLPTGAVVSHVSAAVLHGLDLWAVPLERVHLTRNRSSGGRSGRRLHLHTAPMTTAEVGDIGGVPATTIARTVVDLARSLPFEQAVVIADSALRRRLVDPAELLDAVVRAARRPGNRRAWRVVAFADGRSGSAGESRSRVAIQRAGLPAPQLQHRISSAAGVFIGQVDFWWPEHRTIGEFDGQVKYGRLLLPGQEPGDVMFEEKIREDQLRDEHHGLARWIWRDLRHFDPVAARIRRTFARP